MESDNRGVKIEKSTPRRGVLADVNTGFNPKKFPKRAV